MSELLAPPALPGGHVITTSRIYLVTPALAGQQHDQRVAEGLQLHREDDEQHDAAEDERRDELVARRGA